MAVVYLARDKKHDRPVAIKILHPEIVAGTGADRFLLEIRTLARLQHPHILALLLLHRDRDAEPTVRPRGTRRGTGPGHARHTQGSVGPDEPVTCSGDGLRAWTAPLRLPLVAGRYRRVGLPHAPAYLSCVAGLVGWPGHLRTLARVCSQECSQHCSRDPVSRCPTERRRSESNRRIEVLQTSALPLGYGARPSKVTKSARSIKSEARANTR